MFRVSMYLLAALAISPASAAAAAAPASELAIHFLALDAATQSAADSNAYVDLGAVSANQHDGRSRGVTILRRVAIRLDGAAGTSATARLSVAMTTEMPGCTVRVNGITLSTVPRLITQAHRVGTPVAYDIEVTISANVPAGPFLSALQWVAESN